MNNREKVRLLYSEIYELHSGEKHSISEIYAAREKPFHCEICGAKFSQNSSLKISQVNTHWRETFSLRNLWG